MFPTPLESKKERKKEEKEGRKRKKIMQFIVSYIQQPILDRRIYATSIQLLAV